jgi:hypothetical protein
LSNLATSGIVINKGGDGVSSFGVVGICSLRDPIRSSPFSLYTYPRQTFIGVLLSSQV